MSSSFFTQEENKYVDGYLATLISWAVGTLHFITYDNYDLA